MDKISELIKAIAEGTKTFADLVAYGADNYYGATVAESTLLPISDSRKLLTTRADMAHAVARICDVSDKTSWSNVASGLEWSAKGNFVRNRG